MSAKNQTLTKLRRNNETRCRHILEKSELVKVDDLAWDQVGAYELDSGVLDTLVYMRDVEGFTGSYLVGLGAHRTTLSDPLVRDFLTVWQAEEAAHSRAIGRFLDTYAAARSITVPVIQPSPDRRASFLERSLANVGGPVGTIVAAAHMTWGAANELLTMNGYRVLAQQCEHPMLAELLRRIAAQESRHYSFYLLQAEWRLASSGLARRVLPRVLGAWTPVGVGDGYKTVEEFQRVVAILNSRRDSETMINRMDRRFVALPGLAQLRIYRAALTPTPLAGGSAMALRVQLNRLVVITALVLVLPTVALAERVRAGAGRRLAIRAIRAIARLCGVRFEIHGDKRLAQGHSYVLVPNHTSPIDIAAVLMARPDAQFVAASELFRIPLLAAAMRALGTVSIARGDGAGSRKRIGELSRPKPDRKLVMFAEGGIAPTEEVLAFKTGPFVVAIESGACVVPVAISGASSVLPRRGRLRVHPGNVRVALLEPVPTLGLGLSDRRELAEHIHTTVVDSLQLTRLATAS